MAEDEKKAVELEGEDLNEVAGGENAGEGQSNEYQSCHHPTCSYGTGLECTKSYDEWYNCTDRD